MKINLTPDQQNALQNFEQNHPAVATLVKAVLKHHISELCDVRNIDAKGNMGLQALASQKATEQLVSIFEIIFPDIANEVKLGPATAEKKRQYR